MRYRIEQAAKRHPGPGPTVWLASFPKSGNTWVRAIVTALATHERLFGVNHLGSGAQPFHVGAATPAFGIDARWLTVSELNRVRDALVRRWGEPWTGEPTADPDTARSVLVRKTHEVYRGGPVGAEPFPAAATRAAILVVRDPRDVACSYAPFFGVGLEQAVDDIGRIPESRPRPALLSTEQPWGSWTSHTESWLGEEVPFPVHVVRYEDLLADAVAALWPVFEAIDLGCSHEELAGAVERTRFERLRRSEEERGFRETSRTSKRFFRQGRAGGWREELPEPLAARVAADHRAVMSGLGYLGLDRPGDSRR